MARPRSIINVAHDLSLSGPLFFTYKPQMLILHLCHKGAVDITARGPVRNSGNVDYRVIQWRRTDQTQVNFH